MPAPPITVSPSSATLEVGQTLQLTVDPSGGVKWRCANCAVASVSGAGLLTAHSVGEALITATRGNQSDTMTVTVTAIAPPPIIDQLPTAALALVSGGPVSLPVQVTTDGSSDVEGPLVGGGILWGNGNPEFTWAGVPPRFLQFTYAAPGTYTITLRVVDSGGNEATARITVTVVPDPVDPPPPDPLPDPIPPTAALNFRSGQYAGRPYTLSTAGTTDLDGFLASGTIVWGDGQSTSWLGAPAVDLTHVYAVPGTYTATMTVTDDDGLTAQATRTVVVTQEPTPNQPPIVAFVKQSGIYAGDTFQFSTAGTFDPDGTIVQGVIAWGDGQTTPFNGSPAGVYGHVYAAAGNPTATLTVRDDDGLESTATVALTVSPQQGQNALTASALSVLAGTPVTLTLTFFGSDFHNVFINGVRPTLQSSSGGQQIWTLTVVPLVTTTYTATATTEAGVPWSIPSLTVQVTPVVDPDPPPPPPPPPPPGSGNNAYFDALNARADRFRCYSLRDPAQLRLPNQGGLLYSNTIPNPWSYDATFDAAKATVPEFMAVPSNALAAGCGSGDGTLTFNGFPGDYAPNVSLKFPDTGEVVTLTSYVNPTTKQATVLRGQRGTAAAAHSAGAVTYLANNSVKNMIWLPLGTTDGNIYFFTWDSLWTDSYRFPNSGNNYYKCWQFDCNSTFFEPRMRFDGGGASGPQFPPGFNTAVDVAAIDARSYNVVGEVADYSLTNGNMLGPGVTLDAPVAPLANTFAAKPNVWLRHFVTLNQRANNYDLLSMWVADENRDAVLIYNEIPISVRPFGRSPNSIARFWLELDTSQDTILTRQVGLDLVSYHRNFASLVNPGNVSGLLIRPE